MSIIVMHQTSRPHELGRKANALATTAEKNNAEAGKLLADLKLTKPRGITWEVYLTECGWTFGPRWADHLIKKAKTPEKSTSGSAHSAESDIENIEELNAPDNELRALIYKRIVEGLSLILASPKGRVLTDDFLREVFEEFLAKRRQVLQ